ncbi:MAG: GAF domain-containing sensor histidine kinase, partial [Lentisphaeria bacterium]|nr:GAF domain-containing sensor histidine kinase [Lentisphaeria bacterium]
MTSPHQRNVQYFPAHEEANAGSLPAHTHTLLEHLNQKIAAGQTIEHILGFLFQTTRPVCPCNRVGVAFVEENGLRITSYCNVADYEPIMLGKGFWQDLAHSSLRKVVEEGAVRVINDLELYLQQHPGSTATELIRREGIRSSMTCPLSVDGRNVGLLFRSSRTPGAYGPHEIRMHRIVAERLSQAVEKAYRIEQLEAATRAYIEMLGFVSHELKSPVASMLTDANLMLGGYLGELSSQQKIKLERMAAKGQYLMGLVGEYLDLARIESGQCQPRARVVRDVAGEVVEPAIEIVLPQLQDKTM